MYSKAKQIAGIMNWSLLHCHKPSRTSGQALFIKHAKASSNGDKVVFRCMAKPWSKMANPNDMEIIREILHSKSYSFLENECELMLANLKHWHSVAGDKMNDVLNPHQTSM